MLQLALAMLRSGVSNGSAGPSAGDHPAVVALELGAHSAADLGLSLLAVGGLARGGTTDLWLFVRDQRAVACVETVIAHTVARGLRASVRVADERWISLKVLREWARVGLDRLILAIEALDSSAHDRRCAQPGSYGRVLELALEARRMGVELAVETHWVGQTKNDLRELLRAVERLGASCWSLAFPVTGESARAPAGEVEEALTALAEIAEGSEVRVDARDAPHFRRVLRERCASRRRIPSGASSWCPALNDGRGVLCIDDEGQIFPSESLRITCGTVKRDDPLEVYRFHPTFRTLRDTELFEAPCRVCEFRSLCGGSRARAYALTGKLQAADPLCSYQGRGSEVARHSQPQ